MGATRVPKDAPCIAKRTVVAEGVKTWGAQRAPRARRISALGTAAVVAAAFKAATRLLVVVQACVYGTEAGSVARLRDARKVQKDTLDYVSHMVVDEG